MLKCKTYRAGVITAALAVFAGMSSWIAAASAASVQGPAAGAAAGPAWHVLKQVRSGSFGGFTVIVTAGRQGHPRVVR